MTKKRRSRKSGYRAPQTQTAEILRVENQHLRDENRLLKRKLDLARRVEYLPDCEVFNDLPHDVWSEILEHQFKKKELAVLALVNNSWAQLIREILVPRRPFKRRFRIPNVSRDMEPWISPTWEFHGSEWYYECFTSVKTRKFAFLLCRVGNNLSRHVPIYVQAEHRLVSTKDRHWDKIYNCERRHMSEKWGWGFSADWVLVDNPKGEWLKDGCVEIALKMKVMTETQFFKQNPDYEKVEQGIPEQSTA